MYNEFQFKKNFPKETRSNSPEKATVSQSIHNVKFIEIRCNLGRKKLHIINEGSNFLGENFLRRDKVKSIIKFNREKKSQDHKK